MSLLDTAEKTVDEAVKKGARQAEVAAFSVREALTRYTKNVIHQNVVSDDFGLVLKVVVEGNRIGSVAIDSKEKNAVSNGLEMALSMAKVSRPDPDFKTFPESKTIAPVKATYCKETAEFSPEDMALAVKTVIETALDQDKNVKWSAGAYTTTATKYCIANSLGVAAENDFTVAYLDTITRAQSTGQEGSGYRIKRSRDVKEIDPVTIAKDAAKDAVESMNPKQIPLGEYEAIFKPEAVSIFTGFLGRLGFSSKVYQQGQSFLRGKLGTLMFDEKLTLCDNGRDMNTLTPMASDGEGVPKRAVMLINCGVPENLCYDSYTALKENRESTGHALPKVGRGFFSEMPMPMNEVISSGDASIDELIEDTKRGVLITRLHYVNPTKPDQAIISGMTNDAMWLIEKGEIKHPTLQMRFTESVIRILGNIDLLGDKSTVEQTPSCTMPAIKTRFFRFTGHTEF